MRILFIIDSLAGGGAERSTLDYCLYLMSHNHVAKIVCLRRVEHGFQREAVKAGVDLHFLGKKKMFSQLRELDNICKNYRPDVVHTTLFKSRLRGRLHKILFRRRHKLVESLVTLPFTKEKVEQRNQSVVRQFSHKFLESLLGWLSVNRFIAISNEVKNHYIREHFGIDERKVAVIYRGRMSNPYLGQKRELRLAYSMELGFNEGAIVFIHCGRQDFPKNHLFLLRAFFRFLETKASEQQVILLCLGKKGDMSEEIDALVKKSARQSEILFLGHRGDVAQLLAQSDIFIFPSLYEGLGGSVIEAKAAGLPLIVSDIPVFRELLIENTEAFFGDLHRLDDFVTKMKQLADNDSLRKQMGLKNIESYKNKFQTDQVNSQMLNLYKTL